MVRKGLHTAMAVIVRKKFIKDAEEHPKKVSALEKKNERNGQKSSQEAQQSVYTSIQ